MAGEEARGRGGPGAGGEAGELRVQAGADSTSEGGERPGYAGSRARLTFCAALCCSTFCSTVMAPAAPAATQAAASGSSRLRRPWLPRSAELQGAARTAGEDSAPARQARRRWRQACAGTAGWRRGADGEGHGGEPTAPCGRLSAAAPPRPRPWAVGGRWGAGGRERGGPRHARARSFAGAHGPLRGRQRERRERPARMALSSSLPSPSRRHRPRPAAPPPPSPARRPP